MSLLFDVFVAISNARLALLVKDIELTWTNLVAIFAGIPGMVSNNFHESCGTSEAMHRCLYMLELSLTAVYTFLLLVLSFYY